jgi:hypothetical protein
MPVLGKFIKALKELANRARLWTWIAGAVVVATAAVVAGVTAIAGFFGGMFGQAPLFQLIPAIHVAAASTAWLTSRLSMLIGSQGSKVNKPLTSIGDLLFQFDPATQQTNILLTLPRILSDCESALTSQVFSKD